MVSKVLRKWLWCLFWLTLLLCAYLYALNLQLVYLQEEFDSKTKSAQHINVPVVIGIGDSLLAYSLPHEAQLQKLIRNEKIWVMYYMPMAAWHSFDWLFKSQNGKLHSTTIILQDSLFLNREKKATSFIGKMHLVKRAFYHQYTKGISFRDSMTQFYHPKRPDTCGVRTYENDNIEFIYQDNILNKDTIVFLQSLKTQSKKVLVISLPRADMQKERLQNAWRKKLKAELAKQEIQFISLGSAMPAENYCDGSHPNDIGRKLRTQQFLNLLNGVESSTQ